jgi:hypothetical protein
MAYLILLTRSLGQMVAEFVEPYFQGKLASHCQYRWKGGKSPDELPEGFLFEIESTVIPYMADYTNGLDLVTVMFQDTPLHFQSCAGMTVQDLNGEATALLNSRWKGGNFEVDAGESEPSV